VTSVDERTPGQIIANIEAQGRIVAQALKRLNALIDVNQLAPDLSGVGLLSVE